MLPETVTILKKNQRIWSSMAKVMIKLVSKGQICEEYVNQRF